MRESRNVARKRRMTVLRQLTVPEPGERIKDPGAKHVNQAADIQAFASDCGAVLPLRLLVSDERSGQSEELLIDRPFALIGNAESADVQLVHPDVSRNHAYLQVIEGRVLCCDLASRSGTHWGEEVRSRGWMEPEEPIHVGPYSLKLVENEFADPPSDEMPVAMARGDRVRVSQPNLVLSFLNARSRSGGSRASRLNNPVTLVGWSHLCQLRLQHRSVGRVHCSLVSTADGLWVVDLMCRGGTRLNGESVNFSRIDEGDELEMGRFRLRIEQASAGDRANDDQRRPPNAATSVSEISLDGSSPSLGGPPKPVHAELRERNAVVQPVTRVLPQPELSQPQRTIAGPASPELTAEMPVGDVTAMSLMKQFAAMQQQMFDHTYQLLAVVTNAFQTAHNRQLDLIREELMRVHELNRELYELNRQRGTSEAAAGPELAPAPLPLAPSANSDNRLFPEALAQAFEHPAAAIMATPPAESRAPVVSPKPSTELPVELHVETQQESPTVTEKSASPISAGPAGPDVSATNGSPTPNGRRGQPSSARKRQGRQSGNERHVDAAVAATAAPEVQASDLSAESTAAKPAEPAIPEQDVHAWLSGRINELTQERSSRWQRILQLLTSGGG